MARQPGSEIPLDINIRELETKEKFDEAFEMVLNDEPTEPVDAIFLHALSFEDDSEMFPWAAKLIKEGKAKYVVINGSSGERFDPNDKTKAWAGADEYVRQLTALGVNREQIILSKPALHTRQANDAYLQVAKDHGWKTAVTLNQPQQLLRATLGQIQSMKGKEKDQEYPMRVYATFPLPWNEEKEVHGPQGEKLQARYKLLAEEYKRILKYQGTGELATFDEFFDYMDKRAEIR